MSITIQASDQKLTHVDRTGLTYSYSVSTGLAGMGEEKNSFKTPRGRHIVRAIIGRDCPKNAIFVARRWLGECFTAGMEEIYPGRDWILSRILWLSGCEPGYNRLGRVDTMQRYIYIHGTPETYPVGVAGSHGCIRMHSDALIDLTARINVGEEVLILE